MERCLRARSSRGRDGAGRRGAHRLRPRRAAAMPEDVDVPVHDAARCFVHPGDVRPSPAATSTEPSPRRGCATRSSTRPTACSRGDRRSRRPPRPAGDAHRALPRRPRARRPTASAPPTTRRCTSTTTVRRASSRAAGTTSRSCLRTTREAMARMLDAEREAGGAMIGIRVGLGFDVHRLEEGRPCVLGGVELPHPTGPAQRRRRRPHAITDAVTGAAGFDDIGSLFPDDDPRWEALTAARAPRRHGARRGRRLATGVDVVIATEDRRSSHRTAIRASLAEPPRSRRGRRQREGQEPRGHDRTVKPRGHRARCVPDDSCRARG